MNDTANTVQALRFLPLSLSQKEQVEAIRRASGNTLYLYTFASLFSWQGTEQYSICLTDEAFLVKDGAGGEHAYLFPCGTDAAKKTLIDALLAYETPVFYTVRDEDKQFLEREYPDKFHFEECRDEFPYLYDKAEQIELKGKTYKRLRHQINTGRATVEKWRVEALCEENVERALSLNRRWSAERSSDALADVEAADTALHHMKDLSMWGLLFEADGNDVAYALGTFVTPEIFDISFCKVLDNRLDCYIKWALYQALPAEVNTVDSEEDLGLEGLRRHKQLRIPKTLTRVWKGSLHNE